MATKRSRHCPGPAAQPKLLFLDEPTSGLDPLMQRKFFDLIRKENAAV